MRNLDAIQPPTLLTASVPLDGGLDFLTPASYAQDGQIASKSGAVIDCLNYEIVDRSGYKKIDGFVPFDGSVSCHQEDFYVVSSTLAVGTFANLQPGAYLYASTNGTSLAYGNLAFGQLIQKYNVGGVYYLFYYRLSRDVEPGTSARYVISGSGGPGIGQISAAPRPGASTLATATAGAYTNTAASIAEWLWNNRGIYSAKQSLGTPVSGLKWFKNNLYAIADFFKIEFTSGGTRQIYPGDALLVPSPAAGTTGDILNVVKVNLASGTWAAGTAAGTMLVRSDIRTAAPSTYTGPQGDYLTAIATFPFDATYSGPSANVANVLTVTAMSAFDSDIDMAGLWMATDESTRGSASLAGWLPVDTGWLIEFEDGVAGSGFWNKIKRNVETQETSTPSPTNTRTIGSNLGSQDGRPRKILTGIDFPNAVNGTIRRWIGDNAGTQVAMTPDLILNNGDNKSLRVPIVQFASNSNLFNQTDTIGFFSFAGLAEAIPENAVINGISIRVYYGTTGGYTTTSLVNYVKMQAALCQTSDVNNNDMFGQNRSEQILGGFRDKTITTPSIATIATAVDFGSASDLWDNIRLDRKTLIDPNFGVGINFAMDYNTKFTDNFQFFIDSVEISVNYTPASVVYFFTDNAAAPTAIISAQLVGYQLESGTLQSADAKGVIQVGPELTVVSGNVSQIRSGWTMHSASPTTSNQVATVTADMAYNGFASSNQIKDEGTRYEFLTANFYADERFESLFGVSGAGRAFMYDGTYCTPIYGIPLTEQESVDKDKPRHLAFHHAHLALGYKSGTLLLSAPGDPENFDAVDGAAPITTGDPITGLASLEGTTLGVFCKSSIWSLSGTEQNNYTTQIISPASGCIEYTLANIGNNIIFCDAKGITTLAQSEKYGDFLGSRLSVSVTPWLLPRLTRSANLYSADAGIGLVCAFVSRKKNQYHLWFSDGRILTMSMVGAEQEPQFTFREYYLPTSDYKFQATNNAAVPGFTSLTSSTLVPLAIASDTTDTGEDRVFLAPDYSRYPANLSYDFNYDVLELDRGWGMGGADFPHYFVVGYLFMNNPFNEKTLYKIRLEGLTRNVAPLSASVAKDYQVASGEYKVDVSLPVTPETDIPLDYVPRSQIRNFHASGRNFTIKIENGFTGEYTNLSDTPIPYPPHICQLIHLQHEEGRADA